jgi:thiopurine S-methyltransferase
MTPNFWHQRWQRGEIGWHQNEINLHLQEHWSGLGAKPGERVFVPLCGKTLDLLWLAGEGHHVLGVEISPIAVESLFEENGLAPEVTDEPPFRRYQVDELTVLCGDFFDLTPAHLEGVSTVYDRASLIALPPDMRPRYAEHLLGLLRPQARILLITLDYDQAEMAGPPFSLSEGEVRHLLGGRFDIRRLAELDVWAENPRFQQRGLSRLSELVFGLFPCSQGSLSGNPQRD